MTTLAIQHQQFINNNLEFDSMLSILHQFPLDLKYYIASMTGKFEVLKGKLEKVIGKLDKKMPIFRLLETINKIPAYNPRFTINSNTTNKGITVIESTLMTNTYSLYVVLYPDGVLTIQMGRYLKIHQDTLKNLNKLVYLCRTKKNTEKHYISDNYYESYPPRWENINVGTI
jgi:hypothetical protein